MARRSRSASAITRLISAIPATTAEKGTNCARVVAAISRASVVLPEPGGPQKISDGTRSESIARRRNPPSPTTAACPTTSSRLRGRIRSASGAPAGGSPAAARAAPEDGGAIASSNSGVSTSRLRDIAADSLILPRRADPARPPPARGPAQRPRVTEARTFPFKTRTKAKTAIEGGSGRTGVAPAVRRSSTFAAPPEDRPRVRGVARQWIPRGDTLACWVSPGDAFGSRRHPGA